MDMDVATTILTEVRVGFTEFRTEIAGVQAEMRAGFAELRNEIKSVRTEMHGEFTEVRGEIEDVRSGMAEMHSEMMGMQTEISDMKTEMRHMGVLLEDLNDRTLILAEGLAGLREEITDMPKRDECNALKQDVAAIKVAVRDTNRDVQLPKNSHSPGRHGTIHI